MDEVVDRTATGGGWGSRLARSPRMRTIAGLTGARGLASVASAAWLVVAARHLSLDQFGDLSTLLALLAIAIAVSDAGLQHILASFVAERGRMSSAATWVVVRRRLVYAGVTAVVLVPAYVLAVGGQGVAASVVILGSLFGTAVYQTELVGYRMLGRVGLEGANEVASRCAVLAIGWVVLGAGGGVVAAAAAYAVADLVSAAVVTLRLRGVLRWPSVEADGHIPEVTLRSTLGLAVATAFAVVYSRVDIYLVALLDSAGESGLYAAGARLLEVALLPALVVGGLVLGHIAPVAGPARARELARSTTLASGLALVPATLVAVLAPWLMPTVFGADFGAATAMARILAVSAVPAAAIFVATPVGAVYAQRFLMACVGGALAANVVANLLVVPRFGGEGAAWVNLATQLVLAAVLLTGLHRRLSREVPGAGPVQS